MSARHSATSDSSPSQRASPASTQRRALTSSPERLAITAASYQSSGSPSAKAARRASRAAGSRMAGPTPIIASGARSGSTSTAPAAASAVTPWSGRRRPGAPATLARRTRAGGPVAARGHRWHHRRVASMTMWAQSAALLESFSQFAEDAAAYGYWAVLLVVAGDGVFPVLPGETAIVAAAVLAADGSLSLPLVILAGAVGAMIGDSAAYWIGRAGGGPIKRFVTRFAGEERLEAAERMVRRQGAALVFVGRFLPGIRIAINLSCGAGQMAYPRFLFFDALGGAVRAAPSFSLQTPLAPCSAARGCTPRPAGTATSMPRGRPG